MLEQSALQGLGQQRVGRDFMGACRAALEMDADIVLMQRGEPSPLVVEEFGSHVVAVHLLSLVGQFLQRLRITPTHPWVHRQHLAVNGICAESWFLSRVVLSPLLTDCCLFRSQLTLGVTIGTLSRFVRWRK